MGGCCCASALLPDCIALHLLRFFRREFKVMLHAHTYDDCTVRHHLQKHVCRSMSVNMCLQKNSMRITNQSLTRSLNVLHNHCSFPLHLRRRSVTPRILGHQVACEATLKDLWGLTARMTQANNRDTNVNLCIRS